MSALKKLYFLLFDKSPIVTYGISQLLTNNYSFARSYMFNDEDTFLYSLNNNFNGQEKSIVLLSADQKQFISMQEKGFTKNLFEKFLVIILSSNFEELFALQYFNLGAKGFLTHKEAMKELPAAIKDVLAQRIFISKSIFNVISTPSGDNEKIKNPLKILTEKELVIMKLMMKGWRIKTIAEKLQLHPSTIGTFKIKIFSKLSVDNIIALRDVGVKNGIL